jgi:hypothetical protein
MRRKFTENQSSVREKRIVLNPIRKSIRWEI